MMEYFPEWEYDYKPPMPKVKPCKDPKIEEDAIKKIMSLAMYGAAINAQQKGEDMFVANYETIQLFKDAGLIK